MKRRELVARIEKLGAELGREGAKHTLYRNPRTGRRFAVPRHAEIKDSTAHSILRDAGE